MIQPTTRVMLAAAFTLGALCYAAASLATQRLSVLYVPVAFVVFDHQGQPVHDISKIEVTRLGSRVLSRDRRLVVVGQPDRLGYVRSHVHVPCDPALATAIRRFVP